MSCLCNQSINISNSKCSIIGVSWIIGGIASYIKNLTTIQSLSIINKPFKTFWKRTYDLNWNTRFWWKFESLKSSYEGTQCVKATHRWKSTMIYEYLLTKLKIKVFSLKPKLDLVLICQWSLKRNIWDRSLLLLYSCELWGIKEVVNS